MRQRRWRGTLLFAGILTVLGLTVGVRLYGVAQPESAQVSALTPRSTTSATPTPSASASTPTATASAAPAPTAAAPAAPAVRTIDGDTVQTRYGAIQVQVTLSGSTITKVTELQAPNEDGRSVEINQQAGPMLEQEVLASQSAKIDTISGATYTSEGYIQSLQSALDKA
ncbi:FMN-binding protein [uncultured Leifsonia sp.]|uniref:FMN-binding protein n=1 Tax=uncultured Leifsonia sp. TaxID=340359 RepID=UPI0028D1D3C2|nr:FMN-binding protein [uncultured Leifsonia sp.]